MHHPTDRSNIALIRSLDGMAVSLLATAVIVAHPRLGTTPLGHFGNIHIIPVTGMLVAAFCMTSQRNFPGPDSPSLFRLRLSALMMAGFSPFVSWWMRNSNSLYFTSVGSIAVCVTIWFLVETCLVLQLITQHYDRESATRELKLGRSVLIYFILIPTFAAYTAFLAAWYFFPGTTLSDLPRTWMLIPQFFRYAMLLPILNVVRLLRLTAGTLSQAEIHPAPQQAVHGRDTFIAGAKPTKDSGDSQHEETQKA